jgi:hypothetical protein
MKQIQACLLISCLACSLILKMEARYLSEISVDFQLITWYYILEDRAPHNHCCENLKSCTYPSPRGRITSCLRSEVLTAVLRLWSSGMWCCVVLNLTYPSAG